MSDILYLAWCYLRFHPLKTFALTLSIALLVYVPVGLNIFVSETSRQLTLRAASTPLLMGARGSRLELVLNSLYFESDLARPMHYGEIEHVRQAKLAQLIPLYARFQADGRRIVGTHVDYFSFRKLVVAEGQLFNIAGECVLGADVAQQTQLGPGDTILSSPENVFDLGGVFPLKMRIVGILAPTQTPDDRVIFTDLKTTWIIEGFGHGHAATKGLDPNENDPAHDPSIPRANEITSENAANFHFHGNQDRYPVTAAIALPHDEKSSTLLQGFYVGDDSLAQVVRPAQVMEDLLHTVVDIQHYLALAIGTVSCATITTTMMVFVLSLQLRQREFETIKKIGGSQLRTVAIMATEIGIVLSIGILTAFLLIAATHALANTATEWFVQWM